MRMLRKSLGLPTVAVLSLAIGIGGNSAIFSVVDALLLRPLPYPEPERPAAVWLHSPGIGIFRDWPSPGHECAPPRPCFISSAPKPNSIAAN
jgi:hypothetical protein